MKKSVKMTKQGVRDLGGNSSRPPQRPKPPPFPPCYHEFDDHCGSTGKMPCGVIICTHCGYEPKFW